MGIFRCASISTTSTSLESTMVIVCFHQPGTIGNIIGTQCYLSTIIFSSLMSLCVTPWSCKCFTASTTWPLGLCFQSFIYLKTIISIVDLVLASIYLVTFVRHHKSRQHGNAIKGMQQDRKRILFQLRHKLNNCTVQFKTSRLYYAAH